MFPKEKEFKMYCNNKQVAWDKELLHADAGLDIVGTIDLTANDNKIVKL